MTRFALPALAVTVLLLLALPPFLGLSLQNALTKMLIASLFAAAFNLLAGQAGLLSFGHAAYFGIGAIEIDTCGFFSHRHSHGGTADADHGDPARLRQRRAGAGHDVFDRGAHGLVAAHGFGKGTA